MSDKGGYAVRKVKSLRGMEGIGFNAELCRDGKPVAYVMDDANGGEYRYDWYDHDKPRVAIKGVNYVGNAFEYQGTPEEAKLQAYLSTLPLHTGRSVDRAHYGDSSATLSNYRPKFSSRTAEPARISFKTWTG